MSMDIKQIIQHQDTLIALSASGRLYRLEIEGNEILASPIKVAIVGRHFDKPSALLADQAG